MIGEPHLSIGPAPRRPNEAAKVCPQQMNARKEALALQQLALSREAHEKCMHDSDTIVYELQSALQSKVSTSLAIIGAMQARVTSLKKAIEDLQTANTELEAAVQAK